MENKNLLLIKLGVGFNTPGIIKFPFEKLTSRNGNTKLIRINNNNFDTFYEISDKLICINENCSKTIENILNILAYNNKK